MNAIFRSDAIWYAQTVGLPAGGPAALTHTAAQWVKLNTSGDALDAGRVDDPAATSNNGGKWYAYPSIAVNMNNDVMLGFSQFSSAQFPSAGYTMRLSTDPPGTMRDPLIAKAGVGFYWKTYGGDRNRWGDYSATQVDPLDDTVAVDAAGVFARASRDGQWVGTLEHLVEPGIHRAPSPATTTAARAGRFRRR